MEPPVSPSDFAAGLRDTGPNALLEAVARVVGQRALDDLAAATAALAEREQVEAGLRHELAAMRDSERRMALALAGSNTGIWDRDVPNDRIYYSPGWKAMLGYAVSEIGDQLAESYTRVHPDDLAYVRATIQAHFDQKTPVYEVEHRLRCKDGSYKWVSSRGRVVRRDGDGRPLRMIGTTTDITVMRDMSERLRQTAELLTSLTDEVPGLVFQYQLLPDGGASFPYASAGIREIYELEPQDVAATAAPLDAVIHAEDLDAYYRSLEASARSLSPWHLEYRVVLPRQGLRWRQGDARPRRMADGSILWHGFITDITERQAMEDELRESAMVDALTRLPNRRSFMRQIDAEHERIRRENGKSAAVLMCDLDHFKVINDRWGHATGDEALRHFAGILQEHLRKTDVAGRLGGEEFAIMLRATDLAEASSFARRLQGKMKQAPVQQNGCVIPITLSIGIAVMGAGDPDAESVLSRSDAALYKAKAGGRDRIEQH
jgi:diguanylate cyclase (GGDEF)-like protein/PAS domain S-box-containing protein